ncbi:integrase arm-type DNA-binding domain-containing protein [Pseudomonas sp. R151218B TE3479]
MGAQATRLSDLKIKAAKPKAKDYILTDGNGLQLRVRTNGSRLWNSKKEIFKYLSVLDIEGVQVAVGTSKVSGFR